MYVGGANQWFVAAVTYVNHSAGISLAENITNEPRLAGATNAHAPPRLQVGNDAAFNQLQRIVVQRPYSIHQYLTRWSGRHLDGEAERMSDVQSVQSGSHDRVI